MNNVLTIGTLSAYIYLFTLYIASANSSTFSLCGTYDAPTYMVYTAMIYYSFTHLNMRIVHVFPLRANNYMHIQIHRLMSVCMCVTLTKFYSINW